MRKTVLLSGLLAAAFLAVTSHVSRAEDKPVTRETISYKKLKEAMPLKLAELERTKCEGQSMKSGDFGMSTATATYAKNKDGDQPTIDVTVVDYSNSATIDGTAALLKMEHDAESDDEYTKTIKLDGNPAMEQFNTKNKTGTLTVVVANRFLLTVSTNGMEEADFKKLQGLLPLKDLAALAK